MGANSATAASTANAIRAVAQAVAGELTRAAIFLVVKIKPGAEHHAQIRSFCGELASLVRAVGFRDIEAGLSCVMGFGHEAWNDLFGQPRPKDLHVFPEISA